MGLRIQTDTGHQTRPKSTKQPERLPMAAEEEFREPPDEELTGVSGGNGVLAHDVGCDLYAGKDPGKQV
jgi:hypothetical protein